MSKTATVRYAGFRTWQHELAVLAADVCNTFKSVHAGFVDDKRLVERF